MNNEHNILALCKHRFHQADEFVQQIRTHFENIMASAEGSGPCRTGTEYFVSQCERMRLPSAFIPRVQADFL